MLLDIIIMHKKKKGNYSKRSKGIRGNIKW